MGVIRPIVAAVSAFETQMKALDDHALAAKTAAFKERLAKA